MGWKGCKTTMVEGRWKMMMCGRTGVSRMEVWLVVWRREYRRHEAIVLHPTPIWPLAAMTFHTKRAPKRASSWCVMIMEGNENSVNMEESMI